MTGGLRTLGLAKEDALNWLERSLAAGHELSAAVLAAAPFDRGRFCTLVPSDLVANRVTKFHEGGIVETSVADAALARLLGDLVTEGGSCVVAEDDLLRRSDPAVARRTVPSAFIGNHVVHWCDLVPGSGAPAARALRASASGYPLNAFVVTRSAADLGLVTGRSLSEDFTSDVVGSLVAVVVSAFDAESFLVWDGAEPS